MKNNSVEAKKAQFMVENAMGDITRATRKVLMDYISKMYFVPLAKAIARKQSYKNIRIIYIYRILHKLSSASSENVNSCS